MGLGQSLEEIKYDESDVIESEPWKAHDDSINCVTYIKDLKLIATCAFDYHVYVWDAEGDKTERVGSLLLGNKALPPDAIPDAEQRRYKAQWKVSVDKMTRYQKELDAARKMYEKVLKLDYNKLRADGARKKGSVADIESKRPIASQLKTEAVQRKKAGGQGPLNDEFEGKTQEERDQQILNGL